MRKLLLFVLSVLLFVSCDEDSPNEENKVELKISSLYAKRHTFGYDDFVDITAYTEGENLKYSWSCNVGSYAPGDVDSEIRWVAPKFVTDATVKLNLSDGNSELEKSIDINVYGPVYELFEDGVINYANWNLGYGDLTFENGRMYMEPTVQIYDAIMLKNLQGDETSSYDISTKMATKGAFDDSSHYGLILELADLQLPIIYFAIYPGLNETNYGLYCYFYENDETEGSWYYAGDNSEGYSDGMNYGTDNSNELLITIDENKKTIVTLNGTTIINSAWIPDLETAIGKAINCTLLEAGFRSTYSCTISVDEFMIKDNYATSGSTAGKVSARNLDLNKLAKTPGNFRKLSQN